MTTTQPEGSGLSTARPKPGEPSLKAAENVRPERYIPEAETLDHIIDQVTRGFRHTDIMESLLDNLSKLEGNQSVIPLAEELAKAGFSVLVAAAIFEHGGDVGIPDKKAAELLKTALEAESARKPKFKTRNDALVLALDELTTSDSEA